MQLVIARPAIERVVARMGDQRVVALFPEQPVVVRAVALAVLDQVVAEPPEEVVPPVRAIDRVVALHRAQDHLARAHLRGAHAVEDRLALLAVAIVGEGGPVAVRPVLHQLRHRREVRDVQVRHVQPIALGDREIRHVVIGGIFHAREIGRHEDIRPRPARDLVITVAAVQRVIARPAGQQVIAFPAIETIVALAAVQRVLVRPAMELVVAGPAVERVIADIGDQRVIALLTEQPVVVGAVGRAVLDQVVAEPAEEVVAPVGPDHRVIAVGGVEEEGAFDQRRMVRHRAGQEGEAVDLAVGIEGQRHVAGAVGIGQQRGHRVIGRHAQAADIQPVALGQGKVLDPGLDTALDRVGKAELEDVRAGIAEQYVGPPPAEERVVPLAAVQRIVAGPAVDQVIARLAVDPVKATVHADDRVIAAAAQDTAVVVARDLDVIVALAAASARPEIVMGQQEEGIVVRPPIEAVTRQRIIAVPATETVGAEIAVLISDAPGQNVIAGLTIRDRHAGRRDRIRAVAPVGGSTTGDRDRIVAAKPVDRAPATGQRVIAVGSVDNRHVPCPRENTYINQASD